MRKNRFLSLSKSTSNPPSPLTMPLVAGHLHLHFFGIDPVAIIGVGGVFRHNKKHFPLTVAESAYRLKKVEQQGGFRQA
jgi:hypothetical protein